MRIINEPLSIKSLTIKNRIGMSPMCMYSSVDGFATEWHLVHYGTRAVGGAGIIIQEATAVVPEGRISPCDMGPWLFDTPISFAEAVRKTGILTSAVGLITTKEEIETILENKQADMVFLGRELLRNPYFVLNETDVEWPGQYMRGKRRK